MDLDLDQVIAEAQHASKLVEEFIRKSKTAAGHSQWIGYKLCIEDLIEYLNGRRPHLLTPEDGPKH